nr:DUF4365 domain-containing protein [uncultured Merdimonas sp.]
MTDGHIKEELSFAYTQAISAYAGMGCEQRRRDYGIDGSINDIKYSNTRKRYAESGYSIDFQLKATVNAKIKNGIILYDLEIKNYKDLIETEIGTPRILILYCLPREKDEWVDVLNDELKLRKCAYWCSLRGLPDVNNKKKVRIKFPEEQRFTSEELIRLMSLVKGGADL